MSQISPCLISLPRLETVLHDYECSLTFLWYLQAVLAVLTIHTALVSFIVVGFAVYSKHTLLGNHWHSISQLLGPETEDLFTKTRMATDSEVKKALSAAGHDDVRACIRQLKDERESGLKVVRQRNLSLPR